MRTNLVDIMSRISQLESEVTQLEYNLGRNSMTIKTIELNGTEQILKEYPEWDKDFEEYQNKLEEITGLKSVLFKKNNSLTLSNGLTIQASLADITNKKKLLDLVERLINQNPSKVRNTEVNNSYFKSEELAYDKEKMKKLQKELKEDIQKIEFEISGLNSQEFEI